MLLKLLRHFRFYNGSKKEISWDFKRLLCFNRFSGRLIVENIMFFSCVSGGFLLQILKEANFHMVLKDHQRTWGLFGPRNGEKKAEFSKR